jgi:putative oxidoreductase
VLADGGGWELVGMIGLLALVLAACGAGRLSADHLLLGRRLEARRTVETRRPERVGA